MAEALGIAERGKELANRVEAEIESATVTDTDYRPTVVSLYLRGASTQLVLGRNSATHWIVEAAGGQSMAGILDLEGSESISAEGLIVASPEVILVPSGVSRSEVRRGWPKSGASHRLRRWRTTRLFTLTTSGCLQRPKGRIFDRTTFCITSDVRKRGKSEDQ